MMQGVNFPNSIELISSPLANCTGGWKRSMSSRSAPLAWRLCAGMQPPTLERSCVSNAERVNFFLASSVLLLSAHIGVFAATAV